MTKLDEGLYFSDRLLEHLVETQGKSLAAAAHRLGGYPDPTSLPLVKATLKRLAREHGKGRPKATGLAFEALAAIKAKARIQRIHQGNRRRKETEAKAAGRALVDLALLQVMRDVLLRRSEASGLRWRNVELHEGGNGRVHVARSKTDQTAEGAGRHLGPVAVEALLVIRPNEAVIYPSTRSSASRPSRSPQGSKRRQRWRA